MTRIRKPDDELLRYIEENYIYCEDGTIDSKRAENIGNTVTVGTRTYIKLRIKGLNIRRYHVVWFLCKGAWPKSQIDHIDRNCLNDKIDNLREADDYIQQQNRDNYYGYKGYSVEYRNDPNKKLQWRVRNQTIGIELGSHESKEAAMQYIDEWCEKQTRNLEDFEKILRGEGDFEENKEN